MAIQDSLSKQILAEVKRNNGSTLSGVQRKLKLPYRSSVQYHLNRLVMQGMIYKDGFTYYFNSEQERFFTKLPYYGLVQAGSRDIIRYHQRPDEYLPIPTQQLPTHPKHLMLFKVRGDSMTPTIEESSLVLCRRYVKGEPISDKQILIAEHKGSLKIKRFLLLADHGLLISDNARKYDPIPFIDETINIIAMYLKQIG
ncbi:MAG: S24 family peptidase [Methylacidiphilales bacterium]|nr:S24 family peptidase [Candidatus Methylacidiphilales bacterium]